MPRQERTFEYTNSDGEEGLIELAFGPWAHPFEHWPDDGITLHLNDGTLMDENNIEDFQRWLKAALAEAKRYYRNLNEPDA